MKFWVGISILLTVAAITASLVVYANRTEWLPEKVPTHWNIHNQPDAFVWRDQSLGMLLLLPGGMLLMLVLMLVLPWLSPIKFKIEPFQTTYYYLMGLTMVLFAYLDGVILAASMGLVADLGRWLIAGILLILALIGNVLGKVQRNFWIGVRTPWTLASDTVWIRTHRLAAWLFVAAGLAGFFLILVGVPPLIGLAVFGVAIIVPIIYSLVLYKRLEKQGLLGNGVPHP
jgi:uncharacterized membrane protein